MTPQQLDRWERLRAMVRAGSVDFTLLDDPRLLQREHRKDYADAKLDQTDWDADHWKGPRL